MNDVKSDLVKKFGSLYLRDLESYEEFIKDGTSDINKMININDIESKLEDLVSSSAKNCIKFSDDLLKNLDEKNY